MFSVRHQSSLRHHLAAISPYSDVSRHPCPPRFGQVSSAVYLFRHGILEVSYHDYTSWIAPFLRKLHFLQMRGHPIASGGLSFLSSYQSWITDAHVGMLSDQGFRESVKLGKEFHHRYSQHSTKTPHQKPILHVWTDQATRCRISAMAFANAFAGIRGIFYPVYHRPIANLTQLCRFNDEQ